MQYLTLEQVLFIHARLVAETGGEHGIRNLGLLQSAVARPQAIFDGNPLYSDIYSQAAALFLQLNDYILTASNQEVENFVLAVASGRETFMSMTDWFRTCTILNE